jgi:hypothetical protein
MSTLLLEGSIGGASIEVGRATLASNTVEVTTKLSKILGAFGTYYEAAGADHELYCDCTITAGAVTFADAQVAAKEFMYLLIGFP